MVATSTNVAANRASRATIEGLHPRERWTPPTRTHSALSDDQAGLPSRRATTNRRLNGRDVDSAPGERPRDDRVGVPHLTRVELVSAPGGRGYRREDFEDSPRVVEGVRYANRTCDRRSDVRDRSIPPASDLIAEDPESAGASCSDRTLRDDAAPRTVEIRYRCLFDHKVTFADAHDQR